MKNFIKGIAIGIATIVPGVSGGTMAIVVGIYDDLIHAVSSFFKEIKKNMIFLMIVGLGAVLGIISFGSIVDYGLEHFKYPVTFLFLGIVCGGIPILYKQSKAKEHNKKDLIFVIIGFLIVILMTFYKDTVVNLSGATGIANFAFLVFAGVIIAVALILPGISTSFLLLTFGLYDKTIDAIKTIDLNYLIPILIGTMLGVIFTTKLLENFLIKQPSKTYLLILGFVGGSIIEVFPGMPSGLNIIYSILTFIIGLVATKYVSEKYND
ncbi:MAG: DUF368 domain-containing protein [Ignavibacteriales bacterium]